jgi:hypothetical protein
MKLAFVQMDYIDPVVSIIAIELVDGDDQVEIIVDPDQAYDLPEQLEQETKLLIHKIKEFVQSKEQ